MEMVSKDNLEEDFVIPRHRATNGRLKAIPFPLKLMEILSVSENDHAISWMPDGKAFRIIKPNILAKKILRKHYMASLYRSFVRKLQNWGFKQVDRVFSHKNFIRGRIDLAEKMTIQLKRSQVQRDVRDQNDGDHSQESREEQVLNDSQSLLKDQLHDRTDNHARSESSKPKNKSKSCPQQRRRSQDNPRVPATNFSDKASTPPRPAMEAPISNVSTKTTTAMMMMGGHYSNPAMMPQRPLTSPPGYNEITGTSPKSFAFMQQQQAYQQQLPPYANPMKQYCSALPLPVVSHAGAPTSGNFHPLSSFEIIAQRERAFLQICKQREHNFFKLWEERERMLLQAMENGNSLRMHGSHMAMDEHFNRLQRQVFEQNQTYQNAFPTHFSGPCNTNCNSRFNQVDKRANTTRYRFLVDESDLEKRVKDNLKNISTV